MGAAGPAVCAATRWRGRRRTVNEFRFEKVRTTSDEMMLPGALKYGGLSALAALAAPAEVYLPNHHGIGSGHWMKAVYAAAGKPDNYQGVPEKVTPEKMVERLLR